MTRRRAAPGFGELARDAVAPSADPRPAQALLERVAAGRRRTRAAWSLGLPAARREPSPSLRASGVPVGGDALLDGAAARLLGPRWRPAADPAPAARRLRAAFAALRAAWPELHARARLFVRRVRPMRRGGFEGSTRALPGAAFFASGESWFEEKVRPRGGGPAVRPGWKDYEFLVHEAAHQHLFALAEAFPLWRERRPGSLHLSPWTGRRRAAGVLAAGLHAYALTLESLERARAAGAFPADGPALAARAAALRAGFPAGFALAERELEPTPEGRLLLDLVRARVEGPLAARDRLVLLVKAPVAGAVKTRLSPALTPRQAAGLYRALARDVAAAFRGWPGAELWVAYDPASPRDDGAWLGVPRARVFRQARGSLGARIDHAFTRSFRDGAGRVLVAVSDAPDLTPSYVAGALRALRSRESVLGPARDGGFNLVGLSRPRRGVFAGAPWSTADVLARVRANLARAGAPPALLRPLRDVDGADDLAALARRLAAPAARARLPRTAAYLGRLGPRLVVL